MMENLTRRAFSSLLLTAGGSACILRGQLLRADERTGDRAQPLVFQHPGMLQSSQDLGRMREAVKQRKQPVFAGFELLRDHPQSQSSYKPAGASVEIGRNPNVRIHEFDADASAAYQCALMGHIAESASHFDLVATIVDDWASTLRNITGADAVLCAALGGFKLINAAELLRAAHGRWPQASSERFGRMLRTTFLPVLASFAPFANGNWDTAAMKTLMAISIYEDDRALFDRVLVYYMHGCGDGSLENYIYPNGQCQESGRDQEHTQLGLAHMGDCCEMAWHQGLDLYGAKDNNLLKGFEYTARYILGEEVPFIPDLDKTGKYFHKVISPRGTLRPVYEQIYNHYSNRQGVQPTWVTKAAEKVRPEGPGFQADHTGFGTLLYSQSMNPNATEVSTSAHPAGPFISPGVGNSLQLEWLPLVPPRTYLVLREETTGLRRSFSAPNSHSFVDTTALPGHQYTYRIATADDHSCSSSSVMAVAGFPSGWRSDGKRAEALAGTAIYTGEVWRLSASGGSGDRDGGRMYMVDTEIGGRNILTACLQPLFASQSLRTGLQMEVQDGQTVSLMLEPGGGESRERGLWAIRLYTRRRSTDGLKRVAEAMLQPPDVSFGRVMRQIWLRLIRHEGTFTGSFSSDGSNWVELPNGVDAAIGKLRGGMVLNSGLEGVSAEVTYKHVKVV